MQGGGRLIRTGGNANWYARAAMPICSRPLSFRRGRSNWTFGFACHRRVPVDLQHAVDEVELASAICCERDEVGLQRGQILEHLLVLFELLCARSSKDTLS